MVAALVAILGVAGVSAARLNLYNAEATAKAGDAKHLALSAVALARQRIADAARVESLGGTPWRQRFTSGAWRPTQSLDNGTINWRLVDEDGDLADDPTDPMTLEVAAQIGINAHRLAVTLTPTEGDDPITSLLPGVAVTGDVTLYDRIPAPANFTLATNSSVNNYGNEVHAHMEATGSITGTNYHGITAEGVPPLDFPNPDELFAFYATLGTSIDRTRLPVRSGRRELADFLLSPNSNPYDLATDPNGIYIIDLENQDPIAIENLRIVGTLILLNVPAGSHIGGRINMEPAVSNLPTLMVQGDFAIRMSSSNSLYEGLLTQYNPPGTPYRGWSDIDFLDSFPNAIKGLIYVSGNLDINVDDSYTEGKIIVGGDLITYKRLHHIDLPLWEENPPPGFRRMTGVPRIVPGTFRRLID
ncbi:hypothetical protein [Mucisphaera sp.]|uniref:hypothetical protein n=1 Tax=Mucisphaera sp. TaxID=2913024 RepID=UPI003D0D6E58